MFPLMRNTHLLTALFACLFVLMYGLSAIQMAHNRWFELKPKTTAADFTLASGLDARAAARALMDRDAVRGDLQEITKKGFRVVRPGTVHVVAYDGASGATRVTTHTAGFWGMLNRIHHVRGLWHQYALINAWGMFVALISIALFVLGATGIYMWFKLHNERVVGVLILAASFAWSLTAAWLIRTA